MFVVICYKCSDRAVAKGLEDFWRLQRIVFSQQAAEKLCGMVVATTVTMRSGGVSFVARFSVCWNMERVPTNEQYCFGLGRPNHRCTSDLSRVPSPPAKMIDQT